MQDHTLLASRLGEPCTTIPCLLYNQANSPQLAVSCFSARHALAVLFSTPLTVPCTLDSPVLVGVLEPRVLVDGLGAVAAVGCRYCAAHLDLLDVAIGSRVCVRAGSPRPTIGECTMVVQSSPPRPCASPHSDRRSSRRCRLRRCGTRRRVHVAPTMFTSMPFTSMPFTSMWFTPTCSRSTDPAHRGAVHVDAVHTNVVHARAVLADAPTMLRAEVGA